jgi:hypothetical protein
MTHALASVCMLAGRANAAAFSCEWTHVAMKKLELMSRLFVYLEMLFQKSSPVIYIVL